MAHRPTPRHATLHHYPVDASIASKAPGRAIWIVRARGFISYQANAFNQGEGAETVEFAVAGGLCAYNDNDFDCVRYVDHSAVGRNRGGRRYRPAMYGTLSRVELKVCFRRVIQRRRPDRVCQRNPVNYTIRRQGPSGRYHDTRTAVARRQGMRKAYLHDIITALSMLSCKVRAFAPQAGSLKEMNLGYHHPESPNFSLRPGKRAFDS